MWILTTWPWRNGSLTGENYLALAVAESRHRSICVNRNFELLVTRCILIQAYQKKSYIKTKLSNPSRDMLLYSCPYAPIRLVSEFATITLIVGGELWGDTAVQTPSSSAPHHQLLIIIPLHFKRCWGLWKSLAHGSSNWHFVWQSTSHSLPAVDGCKVSQYTRNWPVLSSFMHIHILSHEQWRYLFLIDYLCCWDYNLPFIETTKGILQNVFLVVKTLSSLAPHYQLLLISPHHIWL